MPCSDCTSVGVMKVRLEKPCGQYKLVCLPRSMKVAKMLTYHTPAAWKNVFPVIVVDVNGAQVPPDVSLSSLPTGDGLWLLCMTIQRPLER